MRLRYCNGFSDIIILAFAAVVADFTSHIIQTRCLHEGQRVGKRLIESGHVEWTCINER